MADLEKIVESTTIATVALTATRDMTARWIAGIPQVLVAQVVGQVLGVRERADRLAAITFGLTNALPYRWLREHW